MPITDATFRCYNCQGRFDLATAHELGGDLYCDGCAKCFCGAPATTLDAGGAISCGKCEGSQTEPEGFGKPTGMIVYRGVGFGLGSYGKLPASTAKDLRRHFLLWPDKPRLYEEREKGCVEITEEVF